VNLRLSTSLSFAALLVATSTCGGRGTDLNELVNANPGADGGAPAQGNDPPPTQYQDPFAGAPAYAAAGSGNDAHNPGQSCVGQGCHAGPGAHGDGPAFLIGGTVYQDYYGKIPAAGVEVRVLDSAGHAASAYSGRNGNFYIGANNGNGVTFPAVVGARDGTTTRPMITTLTDTMGSCGQSQCHVVGGSPTMGAYYPIHVP
jgi:hypothetical protein